MLKAILFDFDGVLVESVDIKTKAFAKLFEDEGTEIVDQVVEYHLANGGVSRFKKFDYIYENFLEKAINDEIRTDLGNKFSNLVIQNVIDAPWVFGAKDFLEDYYQKIDLYIVSGTPEDELIDIVDRKCINKYFKGTYGSPETKGNLIKCILEDRGYTKDQVVFIGDAITDLNGALEADIPFIGRVSAEHNNPFKEYNIAIISDLRELPELLK
ncbi:HAD family hydrolase [Methanococcoides sp. AM1]|uniref:HAD family hydrolase n=1 Tax=Methanococcoides sp. AM1 TaxID=1201011 RepID=UPI0010827FEF|nr:HAD hydrolase-like protein [Methanococcoides sp. AM1]